ncbi:unnamed protein product, partial [Ectocarpus fasciculatus]
PDTTLLAHRRHVRHRVVDAASCPGSASAAALLVPRDIAAAGLSSLRGAALAAAGKEGSQALLDRPRPFPVTLLAPPGSLRPPAAVLDGTGRRSRRSGRRRRRLRTDSGLLISTKALVGGERFRRGRA